MKVPFVSYSLQYQAHKDEYDKAIQSCLERGDLILRKDLEDFEKNLADFLGVEEVVGVASGTDALLLSMKMLDIGKGDEVITSSYTFRATVEAILHTGATPVLADIDEDWRYYETDRTKAIIPCHLEGRISDWKLDSMSRNIHMIEDACQAIGAKKQDGIFACYSFYPAKILGGFGDGGAIATNRKDLAAKLRTFRNHDKGSWHKVAYNSRLDNVQAAFLSVKLKYLPDILKRRKEIALMYEQLKDPVKKPELREVYQDYIVEVPDPQKLQKHLAEKGIDTMLNGYPFPSAQKKKFETCRYENQSIRLPCNETLTNTQVEFVIETINAYY